MDKQEARKTLQLFRPGTDDAQDPQMAEALHWVKQDEELAHWFDNHCNVYAAMRRKLREIPVPANLKRDILHDDAARRGRIVDLRNAMLPLAAAAAVVFLAIALWSSWRPSGELFANFRDWSVRQPQRGYRMVLNTNLKEIHAQLLAKNCPDYTLTKPLAKLPAEGYAALESQGRKISMVCLKDQRNEDLFLFVMDGTDMRSTPAAGKTEFARIHRLNSVSWTAGGKVYILAGPGDETELKRYLD